MANIDRHTEVELYLADRAAKCFNVVYGTILAEEDGLTVPNQNGDLPFIDYDPRKPNEPYFEWIDTVIDMAQRKGIIIALAPAWGRWVNQGWHGPPVVLNTSNAASFGHYIGQRYAGLPKIIGGDSNSTASAMYGNETWLSMDGVQTGHSDINNSESHSFYGFDYINQWVPIANQNAVKEIRNEDGSFRWNSSFVRNGAWHAFYAGSAGVTYGEQAVWQFANPARFNGTAGLNETWVDGIKRPASGQIRYLRSYVEEHLGIHRKPDKSLLTTNPGMEYAEIMAIRDRSWAWVTVYAPMGQTFGLNTRNLSGTGELQAWWFIPKNGEYLPLGTIPRSANLSFVPPTGGTIDDDWALLVKASLARHL
ncbi:hypothetical protein IFM47457_03348 [Aspergillus lentulus]|uniref:DUF4038 domain-containing protein n=1 Tax=Aspergillus lentulus TaxID=293939 RepID=A0ABQ1AMC3_ASPLE|nr:hypothetical protein IFM47457_03348 [Aspergillus lentulus]GFF84560.1 hypothetical protein IFM60648_07069 [Aspergillus lentulus]